MYYLKYFLYLLLLSLWIKKILDKVLKVNLGNISKEIIIINDGSTDQTRKLLENYKHEKLKRNDYKYDLLIPIKYNFNNYLHFSYVHIQGYYDDHISQQERDRGETLATKCEEWIA